MSVNQGRAIRQVSSKQTPCKGLFQSLILQPQKHLVQSLYWRLHWKLPGSRTVRLSFVSVVATFVCRFLFSVVKVFSASADPLEVEECRSIKVGRLVKSLGNKLHSSVCFKASSCSPRSTRTGRLLRHAFTLEEERKSVTAVFGSAQILLARSVLELLGWASNEGHVLPLSLIWWFLKKAKHDSDYRFLQNRQLSCLQLKQVQKCASVKDDLSVLTSLSALLLFDLGLSFDSDLACWLYVQERFPKMC